MKLKEIAKKLDFELVGNPEIEITGISYADNAVKTDITIARSKKDIIKTKAEAVVTKPCFIHTDKTLLFTCNDLDYAMVQICKILKESGEITDYTKPVCYRMTDNGIGMGSNVHLGKQVILEPNVLIGNDVIIGDNTRICSGVNIGSGTIIGENVLISPNSVIGADSFYHCMGEELYHFSGIGRVIIQDKVHIGSNTVIQRGTILDTVIGNNCMIGNCIDIGHDVMIGNNCKIVSQTGIASNVVIGNNVLIYGQAGISNGVKIGNNVVVKAKTLVSKSVKDNLIVFGLYGREYQDEMKLQAKIRNFFERKR